MIILRWDKVILQNERGMSIEMEIPDTVLYKNNINEGDVVFLDINNSIHKN